MDDSSPCRQDSGGTFNNADMVRKKIMSFLEESMQAIGGDCECA
jgi:hypothetical protein